ncbi:hypothetical protein ACFXOM_34910 [Streptomyces sp. NPDC059169]|uniref:hypothetical protein n=1 Tax=Streptomyces sp. NPDC059169 TaxID=3346754 RepID=UPI00369CDABD
MGNDCEPGADATLAINQVSAWIVSADTKAGLLAASMGVLVAGLLSQADTLRSMAPPRSVREALILGLTHVVVLSMVVSVWFVLRTLAPRSVTSAPTRYGWPTLVRKSGTGDVVVEPSADPGQARAEAWQHAVDLAVVAELKFAAFRRALTWAVAAGGGLASLLLVIVWT